MAKRPGKCGNVTRDVYERGYSLGYAKGYLTAMQAMTAMAKDIQANLDSTLEASNDQIAQLLHGIEQGNSDLSPIIQHVCSQQPAMQQETVIGQPMTFHRIKVGDQYITFHENGWHGD